MVRVRVHSAIAAECEDDLRLVAADPFHQLGRSRGEVSEFKLRVLVVEHLEVRHSENFAGSFEFRTSQLAEVLAGACAHSIGGGLSIGKADDLGFNTCLRGKH